MLDHRKANTMLCCVSARQAAASMHCAFIQVLGCYVQPIGGCLQLSSYTMRERLQQA